MTQPDKATEPTMEEIVASIRRIIADDEPAGAPVAAEQPPAAPALAAVPTSTPPRSAPVPAPAAVAPPRPVPAPEPPAPSAAAPSPAPLAEADVFDLTESMAAPTLAEGFRTINGDSDLE